MKRKLLYQSPGLNVVELALENSCLQTGSTVEDIVVDNPDPMPFDN